jgi:hypothetical protein
MLKCQHNLVKGAFSGNAALEETQYFFGEYKILLANLGGAKDSIISINASYSFLDRSFDFPTANDSLAFMRAFPNEYISGNFQIALFSIPLSQSTSKTLELTFNDQSFYKNYWDESNQISQKIVHLPYLLSEYSTNEFWLGKLYFAAKEKFSFETSHAIKNILLHLSTASGKSIVINVDDATSE